MGFRWCENFLARIGTKPLHNPFVVPERDFLLSAWYAPALVRPGV